MLVFLIWVINKEMLLVTEQGNANKWIAAERSWAWDIGNFRCLGDIQGEIDNEEILRLSLRLRGLPSDLEMGILEACTYRRKLNQGHRWNFPEGMQAVKRNTQLRCFYATDNQLQTWSKRLYATLSLNFYLFLCSVICLFIHIFIVFFLDPKTCNVGGFWLFLHGVLKKLYGPWPGLVDSASYQAQTWPCWQPS